MSHPSIERAHHILAEGPARAAEYAVWREQHADALDIAFAERIRAEREARQQANADAERETEERSAEWHATVAQWKEARATQAYHGRVRFRDWHYAERAADDDDKPATLLEVAVDAIADEVNRKLQAQRHEFWNEIEKLRAEMQALKEARS